MSRLIRSTANNFRHYNEWKQKNARSQLSIDALYEAGIYGDRLDEMYAADVLILIKPPSYVNLEEKVLKIATEFKAKA